MVGRYRLAIEQHLNMSLQTGPEGRQASMREGGRLRGREAGSAGQSTPDSQSERDQAGRPSYYYCRRVVGAPRDV